MKRRPRFWQVIAIVILLGSVSCGKSQEPPARPPEVAVARGEQRDLPISREWVGTLDGLINAQIKPQVQGYLLHQTYKEGSLVRKGQLLFEIDPKTFQAALEQTKAQLANAEHQLAQAEANQVKAQVYFSVTEQEYLNCVQDNPRRSVDGNRAARPQAIGLPEIPGRSRYNAQCSKFRSGSVRGSTEPGPNGA